MAAHLSIRSACLGSIFIEKMVIFVDNRYRANVYNSCFHSAGG
jgi:hypothetical protein